MDILDHGYLNYVEHWGSDERIIEAARMSTGKGFLGWGEGCCQECARMGRLDVKDHLYINYEMQREAMGHSIAGGEIGGETKPGCPHCKGSGKAVGDEKLLRYLWEMRHSTPFEMAGMVIEVQAPIMVFREWHRHRTQSFNEMSARYVPLPDVNYVPSVERVLMTGGANKQASGTGAVLDERKARWWREDLRAMYEQQEALYQMALQNGVPKELARLHLPVGRYSRMRASANLRNWLAFLTLRMDEHAQWEIRMYANAIGELIAEHFPRTWELFNGQRSRSGQPAALPR
jgi:thymidylate synthase (FAD)